MDAVFDQITVLGPGLLGASLLMAVKQRKLSKATRVWARRPEVLQHCLNAGLCDGADATPEAAVRNADLVIICTPVSHIQDLLKVIAPCLKSGALVTDVGSTKDSICTTAAAHVPSHATFIGSHPMAGSEKSGLEHATPNLFEDRTCFVTPTADIAADKVATICSFWEQLGMNTAVVSPAEHDAITAHISHLPHLLASSLAAYLAGKNPAWAKHCGNGLRDTTRIAAGSPDMWQQIFAGNQPELLAALDGLLADLHEWRQELATHNYPALLQRLETGKSFRDSLP